MDALHYIILTFILLIATVTDLRERRIPNKLTYPAMLLALCWHYVMTGADGLVFASIGLAAGFGTMLIPFLMGYMGAGDVKLMAVAGAFLGPAGALKAFLFTSLVGGVYAVAVVAWRSPLTTMLASAMKDSKGLLAGAGTWVQNLQGRSQGVPQLAYGAAIAAGTIISVISDYGMNAFVPVWWA
ncbi:A24 family peptidase [Desulfovibrio ferrophilus]|uniref:Peptidase A24A, prepilin type IV n=1 Tax=Desulfovibrio ferrophilus TaxID=241368 RepID=A0A2Z6AY02_9BACT|nr:A24 family peptidase [Desulfovibrio ferrophilus]BBD08119.1 peptidase A24A, prepilin type IV [Desulfovibrio ferrophilus]